MSGLEIEYDYTQAGVSMRQIKPTLFINYVLRHIGRPVTQHITIAVGHGKIEYGAGFAYNDRTDSIIDKLKRSRRWRYVISRRPNAITEG